MPRPSTPPDPFAVKNPTPAPEPAPEPQTPPTPPVNQNQSGDNN